MSSVSRSSVRVACQLHRAWFRADPAAGKLRSSVRLFHLSRVNTATPWPAEDQPQGPGPAQLREVIQDLRSGPVRRLDPQLSLLPEESLRLLSSPDLSVEQLCHMGQEALTLEGPGSAVVARVLDRVGAAMNRKPLSPREAERAHGFMAECSRAGLGQGPLLASLDSQTCSLVYQLTPGQVRGILQALRSQSGRQVAPLVLRLSRRASWILKSFSDQDLKKVLSVLMELGQHDPVLLDTLEYHLPGRLHSCDPELICTVMDYCLQMKCRSEPIFEAVAENFVENADTHSTEQIATQIVAMGRLNYLPQCSSQMFKKLESVLSLRFSHFQPRLLIEVLHACILLQRFPLNYMSKVFSPYFLQRVQGTGGPPDKKVVGQLTQLHLSMSLECSQFRGPWLPSTLHIKRFSTLDEAFETPMDLMLYRQVRAPLSQLLGGRCFLTQRGTPSGYTVDVEICLDQRGYVLPRSQRENAHRRIALCLDGENRFCSNTQHLLGKEAIKRRHLSRTGYEVVQISYSEVERLQTKEEWVQYLHSKIFPTISKFRR